MGVRPEIFANSSPRGIVRNLLSGDKRGDLGDGNPPAGSRGRSPVRSGGEAGDMLNIRLNIAIDRHKSRTVQTSESDYTLKKFPAVMGGHAPHVPPGYATVLRGSSLGLTRSNYRK